jgi:choline dehydrogenase
MMIKIQLVQSHRLLFKRIYQFSKTNSKYFDYIILGGGTAGCLLANRLSRDPAIKVALIEAGNNDNYPTISLPIGYLWNIGNPKMDWCYKSA